MMVFLDMTADLRMAGRNLVVKRSKRTSGSELGSRASKREKDWTNERTQREQYQGAERDTRRRGAKRVGRRGEEGVKGERTDLLDSSLDLHELAFVRALGPDLAGHVGERLVEQRTDLGRLVGREEDRLAEELGPEEDGGEEGNGQIGWSADRCGDGQESSTHCPSRYQGLTREKSQPWASSGRTLSFEKMNLVEEGAKGQPLAQGADSRPESGSSDSPERAPSSASSSRRADRQPRFPLTTGSLRSSPSRCSSSVPADSRRQCRSRRSLQTA